MIISFLLSKSVACDYQLLLKTKTRSEKQKRNNALIQSERVASLTILVADMAHEVNTPIGLSVTANSCAVDALSNLSRTAELVQSYKQIPSDQAVDELKKIELKLYNTPSK